jgi:hypothetical protein
MGTLADAIAREVLGWPGVEAAPHRFGGVEFRLRGREIGHLHGDRLADLPFPARMRDAILASGRAVPHHILPDSGWVSCWIRGEADVANVVTLFRMQYDRVMARA